MDARAVRLPEDLLEAAEAAGVESGRSTAAQVVHWAQLGRYFEGRASAAQRRVQRAIAGEIALGELDAEEAALANALIDAAISAAASEISLGAQLAADGVTTVSMDDEGRLVSHRPDGTTTFL